MLIDASRWLHPVRTVIAGIAAVVLMSACTSYAPHRPAAAAGSSSTAGRAASSSRQCRVTRSGLLMSAQVPGFTQFVIEPRAPLPVHTSSIDPPQFVRNYVCGEFYGFITNKALTGTYRRQNIALARQYGYQPGEWPLVPLRGQIVADLSHQVLEIYESLYQFTTATAVKAYLPVTENSSPYPEHRIALALAPGAVVIANMLGPDPRTDEHAIYIAVPHGDYAISLQIQGGRSLTWADVKDYWKKLAPRISALGG